MPWTNVDPSRAPTAWTLIGPGAAPTLSAALGATPPSRPTPGRDVFAVIGGAGFQVAVGQMLTTGEARIVRGQRFLRRESPARYWLLTAGCAVIAYSLWFVGCRGLIGPAMG